MSPSGEGDLVFRVLGGKGFCVADDRSRVQSRPVPAPKPTCQPCREGLFDTPCNTVQASVVHSDYIPQHFLMIDRTIGWTTECFELTPWVFCPPPAAVPSCRYAPGDPVETWLHNLLCLDAASHLPKPPAKLPHPDSCELFYVERDTLFSFHKASEAFLQRVRLPRGCLELLGFRTFGAAAVLGGCLALLNPGCGGRSRRCRLVYSSCPPAGREFHAG